MQVKERLPLKKILLAASVLLALLLIVVLAFPSPAVQEPEATPEPTPPPTAAPTPTPAPTPEPEIYRPDNIYYSYDPALFVTDARGRITYTGEGYTSLTGIDVSEHQYDINWQQVANDGIDFAIIRSGYRGYSAGSLNEDKYFRQNMDGATAAGIPIGVYFFSQATSVREARDEANYVLEQIKDYDVTLPVVYDLEILGQNYRTYNMSRRTIYECARAFCDTVREAGYKPMIYMTQYLGYQKYTLRELTDYGFWFAEYYVQYPSFVYDFEIWQYSDTGSVAGVNGNVDLDLWLVPEE